jgi:hypothetical protein
VRRSRRSPHTRAGSTGSSGCRARERVARTTRGDRSRSRAAASNGTAQPGSRAVSACPWYSACAATSPHGLTRIRCALRAAVGRVARSPGRPAAGYGRLASFAAATVRARGSSSRMARSARVNGCEGAGHRHILYRACPAAEPRKSVASYFAMPVALQ